MEVFFTLESMSPKHFRPFDFCWCLFLLLLLLFCVKDNLFKYAAYFYENTSTVEYLY